MKLNNFAALLAFIIGAMAIYAGGQVIFFGKQMSYYVINWLPYYNFAVGLITFVFTAGLIWKDVGYATPVAIATFGAHAIVMLILQIAYKNVVAPESIRAMTVRIVAWAIILVLLYLHGRAKIKDLAT